jgi:hypothetical protein
MFLPCAATSTLVWRQHVNLYTGRSALSEFWSGPSYRNWVFSFLTCSLFMFTGSWLGVSKEENINYIVVLTETDSKRRKRPFGPKGLAGHRFRNFNLVQVLDLFIKITYFCSYCIPDADSKRFPVLSTFSQRGSLKW